MMRREMSDEELRIGTRDEVLRVGRYEMLDCEKRDEMKEHGRGWDAVFF